MRFPSTKKLPFLALAFVVGMVAIMMLIALIVDAPSKEEAGLWGTLQLKDTTHPPTEKQSNYQRIREKTQQPASRLRYREQKTKENPFFSFYREEKKYTSQKAKKPAKQKQPHQEKAFFSFSNTDLPQEKVLYEAIFRESQQVQPGKSLRLFLQEPIEALQLKEGTILKGIPRLVGNRIKINITAAVIDKQVRPIQLICLDKEDCLEGLYQDALAARIEEDTKAGLLEELWDMGIEKSEVAKKGSRVVRRFSSLNKHTDTMLIESGKTLFVMLPQETGDY